jgi:hypothetical protein
MAAASASSSTPLSVCGDTAGSGAIAGGGAAKAFLDSVPTISSAKAELERHGYECWNDEKLTRCGSKGSEGFTFAGDKEYGSIGAAVQQLVYAFMKHRKTNPLVPFTVSRMRRRKGLPKPSRFEAQCWRTRGALTTTGTVLVLLQGSGVVRPGIWARSLCINDSFSAGTMLPWVDAAADRGWECVILNPNDDDAGGSATHASAAWKGVLGKLPASRFAVLAHSRGGVGATQLFREAGATERIAAVAMTDAVHDCKASDSKAMRAALAARCVDWRRSPADLDAGNPTSLSRWVRTASQGDGIPVRPAMTPEHVWTTPMTFAPVFEWLDAMVSRHTEKHASCSV